MIIKQSVAVIGVLFVSTVHAAALVVDFESQPLGPQGFDNGAAAGGVFDIDGALFNNEYLSQFDAWSGWALSSTTDTTTPGFLNQYSAYGNLPHGGGAQGSVQYAVAYSGLDVGAGVAPRVTLPAGALPVSADITSTTYAALSILNGDNFARAFVDGDWFRLTIHALDSEDQPLASIEHYLADYRDSQQSLLSDWTEIDLTPLQSDGVRTLEFRLASSDAGLFGMNTPAYFALDNLTLSTPATGDYTDDGTINAADYVVWRDTDGSPAGYDLWASRFAAAATPAAASVAIPEADSALMAVFATLLFMGRASRVPSFSIS